MTALSFGIVVPTLNSEETLSETLMSISSQLGSNPLHVHVQDGGSTDDTVMIAQNWADKVQPAGRFTVSINSRADSGPAEALHHGLNSLRTDVMTWLGADDILLPHAITTVVSFLRQHPETQWVTGVAQQINECGVSLSLRGVDGSARIPTGFLQRALARGAHASTFAGFIQQEGTFWTATAWQNSGKRIETRLRLAFDFELWCRMAKHHELVQLATPLAMFRRRAGQLSEDSPAYAAEVRQVRESLGRIRGFKSWHHTSHLKPIALYSPDDNLWQIKGYVFGRRLLRRIGEGALQYLRRNSITRPPKVPHRAP